MVRAVMPAQSPVRKERRLGRSFSCSGVSVTPGVRENRAGGIPAGSHCPVSDRGEGSLARRFRTGDLGFGLPDRLTPNPCHPPYPLRPEGESPSGERGERWLIWCWVGRGRWVAFRPHPSPQPPSFSQTWEKEGGDTKVVGPETWL